MRAPHAPGLLGLARDATTAVVAATRPPTRTEPTVHTDEDTGHGPGCWDRHDLCALAAASTHAELAAAHLSGIAARFTLARRRARDGDRVVDGAALLATEVTAARAYLTDAGCLPIGDLPLPSRAPEYARRRRKAKP